MEIPKPEKRKLTIALEIDIAEWLLSISGVYLLSQHFERELENMKLDSKTRALFIDQNGDCKKLLNRYVELYEKHIQPLEESDKDLFEIPEDIKERLGKKDWSWDRES